MEIVDVVRLHYCHGTSDKVYRIEIQKVTHAPYQEPTYRVMAYWGRRTAPETFQQEKGVRANINAAALIMHGIMREKLAKGYVLLPASPTPRRAPAPAPAPVVPDIHVVAPDTPRKGKSVGGKETSPAPGRRLRI